MTIRMSKYGSGVDVEIQTDIADSNIVKLRQELERQMFQRTFQDIKIRLNNLRKKYTSFFMALQPTDRIDITVFDEQRCTFFGQIDNASIEFQIRHDWIEFSAFSTNKQFWDHAKRTKVITRMQGPYFGTYDYYSLEFILQVQLQRPPFDSLFTGYNIDVFYKNRNIRGWDGSDEYPNEDPSIGTIGRFGDLDPSLTMNELLLAMAKYYNAEFFIDPGTGQFTMKKRGDILNSLDTNIDDILHEDVEPKLVPFDQAFDYIQAIFSVPKIDSPILDYVAQICSTPEGQGSGTNNCNVWNGLHSGVYVTDLTPTPSYRLTALLQLGASTVETEFSDELLVELERPGDDEYDRSYNVALQIPGYNIKGITVLKRYLWRQFVTVVNGGLGYDYFPIAEFAGNAMTSFVDDIAYPTISRTVHPLPVKTPPVMAYVRYNEKNGVWEDPIYDFEGNNAPDGDVFVAIPELRWIDPNDPTNVIDSRTGNIYTYYVFRFFGSEGGVPDSINILYQQYIDLFRRRQKLICQLKGTNFAVGDSLVSMKILPVKGLATSRTRFLLRSADININKRRSDIEAVNV